MARDGSGTFNRLYNWVDDRDASIPITASRMDAEQDGIATALTNSIAKDGQTNPTANLPMNSFKHTGVANSNARDQYLATGQYQDASVIFAVGGGSANAQTLTLSPAITAYTDGMMLNFEAGATNTSAMTLNVNSVGAQSVVMQNGDNPPAGAITSGRFYTVIYDETNTNWVLIDPSVLSGISVISENATSNAIDVTADAITDGSALNVSSNSANTNTRELVNFHNDNAAAVNTTVLNVRQDSDKYGVFIDQNGNFDALYIDSESTTTSVLTISQPATTTGICINVNDASGLTTGSAIRAHSDSSDTSTRTICDFINDNTAATGATVLTLQQDSAQRALFIDQNGNGSALEIDSESTTATVVNINVDALTTGGGIDLSSNSSSGLSRNLFRIYNQNTSASSTTPLSIDQGANYNCERIFASNSSYSSTIKELFCARASSSSFSYSTFNSDADIDFNFRGDGNGFCDGSFTGGGADYAEYFEWADGNPTNEDRRGVIVELIGDKIQDATTPHNAFGVISGNPSVVGDAAWNKWDGKYLTDDFGGYIMEDYEVWSWSVENENGIEEGMVFDADKIPVGIIVPKDKKITIQQRRKINPDFDTELEYVPREHRKEWDCVGLMGKLRIRKGQPVNPGWRKMRDISDDVEEWLVK
jgi:hypothetical protein